MMHLNKSKAFFKKKHHQLMSFSLFLSAFLRFLFNVSPIFFPYLKTLKTGHI